MRRHRRDDLGHALTATPVLIERYRSEDRAAVDALYARVFGEAPADAYRRRWDWLYGNNPSLPHGEPLIWLARDAGEIVGQYATMPVTLSVNGAEIGAAWGMDVMVAPERQRTGLGRVLFDTWDRNVGAAIGLGLTDSSYALFKKLQWPDMGRVPRLVKGLSDRFRSASGDSRSWRDAVRDRTRRAVARVRPVGNVRSVGRFDESFTRLWKRVAPRFAFIVRRDTPYLNWKFVDAPHLQYDIGGLARDGETLGYVVLRHVTDQKWRVTILVDFLADPADPSALGSLLRWVDRRALAAGSDLVRACTTNRAFIEQLQASGYCVRDPAMRFVAKINDVSVPDDFYASADRWHVTFGDSDVDR